MNVQLFNPFVVWLFRLLGCKKAWVTKLAKSLSLFCYVVLVVWLLFECNLGGVIQTRFLNKL